MADKRRRKTLNVFRHKHDAHPRPPSSTPESPVSNGSTTSPVDIDEKSLKGRSRMLQRGGPRPSVFGSLRSLHSLDEDEKSALTRSDSNGSFLHEEKDMGASTLLGTTVLLCGEIQTAAGNVFRKRNHFLVLTESHLVRFRSQSKAADMFPTVPQTVSRTTSRISVASYTEPPTATYQDITSGIPLEQIVAVYKLDDGRPFFTIEVSYMDDRSMRPSAMHLQLSDPNEAVLWTRTIRDASRKARDLRATALQQSTLVSIAAMVERDLDYDPDHFRLFKVALRSGAKSTGRGSTEDLTKLHSTICYLAIGLHKLHVLPLLKPAQRSSSTSLNELDSTSSYGVVMLTMIHAQLEEDAFQVTFKSPLKRPQTLYLASCDACEIAVALRQASEFLKPEWLRQSFVFDVPVELEDQTTSATLVQEDYNCFDRTLMAHCSAYEIDTSRIYYTVDHACEDAPRFQLLPTADGVSYSAIELLAVFRALRYNESFVTISFANIDLSCLRYLYDIHATDIDSFTTRSGIPTNLAGHNELPVLCQEVRGLALKSRRLRRFDFSGCFSSLSSGDEERDSCCIPEALVPLCKKSLTNVDWIVLSGNRLADSDINFLVDAASEKTCHLRAIELGECGLDIHDIDILLSTAAVQGNTMEVIDISGAQGRFTPEVFAQWIGAFDHIRRLNLTRVQKTTGVEPLIPSEVLMTWRLEALYLSQTTLNEQTVDSISEYLACARSEILRELHLNQCGLTGRDLAVFFRSMTRQRGIAREMHVSASENRLRQGISNVFTSIAQNCGPTSLTMRMLDFEKEHQFRELIEALTTNTTLRNLDVSRASLPYDASTETCEAIKTMFATNTTLVELDISGEPAHLDATRFGIGLNIALRGLEKNNTLRSLRIQHQSLGLQGVSTLAEMIEVNKSLLEIHCEHNDINLQSFTVLVNALEKNKMLQYLPTMNDDRLRSLGIVRRETETMDGGDSPRSPTNGHKIKRSFTGALTGKKGTHHRVVSTTSAKSAGSMHEQQVDTALSALNQRWDSQVARLQNYLYRNYCFANGIAWHEEAPRKSSDMRPDTAHSLSRVFDRVKLNGRQTTKDRSKSFDLDEKMNRSEQSDSVFQLPED